VAPLALVKHVVGFDFQALLSFDRLQARITSNEKPTFRPSETVSVNTSAFHRTNVEFGKHWSLSALA
jgi:hypothetical protein